jgi:hypothetical protein
VNINGKKMKESYQEIFSQYNLTLFDIMRSLVVIKNLKLSVTAEEVGREFSKYGRVLSSITEWREGWLFLDGRVEMECERETLDVGRMKEICLFEGTRIEICEKKEKKEKLVEERLEDFERRELSFICSFYLFVFKLAVCYFLSCLCVKQKMKNLMKREK